jgi:hypothetical protein
MRWLTALILVTFATACSELASVDRSKIPAMTNSSGRAGMPRAASPAGSASSAGAAGDADDAGAPESDGGA